MKKLFIFLVIFFSLVVVAGCKAKQNTVRFDQDQQTGGEAKDQAVKDDKTVVTVEEDKPKDESAPPKIIAKPSTPTTGTPTGVFAVTGGDKIETSKNYNVVRGTAPTNTARIEVNGYRLTKYLPGQKQWSYIASTAVNTLKSGENSYTARALDKDGNELASQNFSITYTAAATAQHLPGVGMPVMWLLFMSAFVSLGFMALRDSNQ